ncbi:two-component regulator propeller domain-containing protein [Neomegalonema sp.]|uniref:two-component regulator propeller domain-containing protein n=1 Tax=Neomegalonema sp. TaxID=2039713 RepID=UPI002616A6B1|nr:two-component regulator propeller domain-containing protein [Neomegalonema sp.]MDD2868535.1 two-component regulator propeller domain-containing protein [Neomegalonema sp.]
MRRLGRLAAALLLLAVFAVFGATLRSPSAQAETPKRALRFGIEEGLSQSTVGGMIQTEDGRIWIATGEGVTIHGGGAPQYLFRGDDVATGLRSDYLYAIFLDRDGEIWIGTSTGGASLYSDEPRFLGHAPGEGLASLDVQAFAQDARGRVWIGSSQGVFVVRKEDGALVSDEEARAPALAALKGDTIFSLLPLEGGAFLIGAAKRGLFLYEPGEPELLALSSASESAPEGLGEEARALFRDREGRIWAGFSSSRNLPGGLMAYDPQRRRLVQPPVAFPETIRGVMSMAQGDDGRLWFGTRRMGIFVADVDFAEPMENYQAHDWEPHRLGNPDVRVLMPDRTGRMWAGAWNGGASSFSMLPDVFETYYPAPTNGSRSIPAMTWALEEEDGALWIGGQGGLGRLDLHEKRIEELELHPEIWGKTIWSVVSHGGRLLLGPNAGLGVFFYDPRTKESGPVPGENGETLLKDATVRVFMTDAEGSLWVGTNEDGLYKLSADLRILAHHTRLPPGVEGISVLPGAQIRGLSQRRDGRIWIGTDAGLVLHDPKTGAFETIAGADRLPDDNVRAVHETEDGRLFVATGGGLGILSAEDLRPIRFIRQSKAFQSKMLYSMVPDSLGHLWISTNNGLVRHRLSDGEERAFRTSDGLQSREFNFNAFKTLSDGRIALGGVRGLTLFHPDGLSPEEGRPPVLSLKLLERPPMTGEGPQDLGVEPQSLRFLIGVRHFDDPPANMLQMRLEPIDADFVDHQGSSHELHRDNLPAGEYRLSYRGVGASGLLTETRVQSFVVRPGMQGWYRAVVYALLGALALAGLALLRARQIRLRNAELEGIVVEKTRELLDSNQALQESAAERERFYARAAHEIRTPLALIRAPLRKLLGERLGDEERRTLAQVVQRASDRLTQLSDEMTAVAQAGAPMASGRVSVDLRAFLEPICALYADSARARGLELSCEIRGPQAATFDPEAAETILHNLLSNMVKHRAPPVRLRLETDLRAGRLEIRVSDDGPPLPEEALRRLEDFRNAPPDSPPHRGVEIIAATLRRTGGDLAIDRARNEIAVFLPAHARGEPRAAEPEASSEAEPGAEAGSASEAERARILVVEDDRDLRSYLASLVGGRFGPVRTAGSLAAARSALEESPVDLVLCDVMLPDGSGLDFARHMKTHEDFSHTPVIFLTALQDDDSYQSAMEVWADDYLTKPFDPDELLAKIDIRLRAQAAMRAWMLRQLGAMKPEAREPEAHEPEAREEPGPGETQEPGPEAQEEAREEESAAPAEAATEEAGGEEPSLTPQEERLKRAFEDFLERSLSDPRADLAQAAAACLTSDRSLQRKLNALYGKSFSALLTFARMERARRLLTEGRGVGEVAEACGYETATGFSRQFKSLNGVSPSEFSQGSRPEGNGSSCGK